MAPSYSERNYVRRRSIRRAVRYGLQPGRNRPRLTDVAVAVVERFAAVHPAMHENREFIRQARLGARERAEDANRHEVAFVNQPAVRFQRYPEASERLPSRHRRRQEQPATD